MSRRGGVEGQLFVGRLSKNTRTQDLEDVMEQYGRLARCDLKYGAEMGYAFVDFEDRRDAEDAMRYENGRELCGSSIIVEWAKGNPRRPLVTKGYDECYKCHRVGHWARDCPDDRYYGFRRPSRGGTGSRRSRSRSPHRRRSRSRDRRRRSRSRSRGRKHRRSPSKSRSRSRSRSNDHKRRRTSHSRSVSKERQCSPSRSKSRSPEQKRLSRSPNRSPSKSHSRSRSRSLSL